jgi:hypothetical protein
MEKTIVQTQKLIHKPSSRSSRNFFHTVQTNPSPYPTSSNNVNVELRIQQSLTQPINQKTQTGKP